MSPSPSSSPGDGDAIRERIDRLVDERLDGEIADADWQRHVGELGPALAAAAERETALRASLRALPRTAAPDAVRTAILAHAARAHAAGPIGAVATAAKPSPRVIRGGWWWSASALAAACLVVALSVNHQPTGNDRELLAYGRERANSAPPAPEGETRQDAAAAPASAADGAVLAILEHSEEALRDRGQQPGKPVDHFNDLAKEVSGSKKDDQTPARSVANGAAIESKSALKDEVSVAAITDQRRSEKQAGDRVEDLQKADRAEVDAESETAPGYVAKDAKPTYRFADSEGGVRATETAAAPSPVELGSGGGRPAATEASADDAPADAKAAVAGAVDKQRKLKQPAVVAAKPASPPAGFQVKKAELDGAATGAEISQPSAAPRPESTTTLTGGPAGAADADATVALSLADGKAFMTAENRGAQPLVVRRATLVLEGLDRSQRSCWRHATELPAADDTIAAHQKRTWSLALQGTDAVPADVVQLRVRLQSLLSVPQAWPPPASPAASAAPASAAPPAPGP